MSSLCVRRLLPAFFSLCACALAACGGGSSTPPSATPPSTSTPPPTTPAPGNPPTVSQADASRLLEQASFGVTATEVAQVQSLGVNAYLDAQLTLPASQYTGFRYSPHTPPASCKYDGTPSDAASICARDEYSSFQVQRQFFVHALTNSDQLRQRVAFALSQIFVVSSIEIYEAYGLADFENMLLKDAFVNFRTLLEDVTLSPVMGHYLDMANNAKANPAAGTAPNENYAREVMQLMSIGLNALNADGSLQLDSSGVAVATYDQSVVEGFAAVFTGWTYPPLAGASSKFGNPINFDGAMMSFPAQHDTSAKKLLGGLTSAADQSPEQDLKIALDTLFNHPNVGPFIGKQLIQHLVTSNPSPAYVARVAAVFANNGQGVRGDMGDVVKAILSDVEARGDTASSAAAGHLREPALIITGPLRSLGGQSDGVLLLGAAASMGQPIYGPPSVFNYYQPSYTVPNSSALGPEFGIDNASTALARANFIDTLIVEGGAAPNVTVTGSTGTSVDLTKTITAGNTASVVLTLNQVLMHGSLSPTAASLIQTAVDAQDDADSQEKTAAYLILSSAQYQVEQ